MSIEKSAWTSWTSFREEMVKLWTKYQDIGPEALNNLEEDDEKFKKLFQQADDDFNQFSYIIHYYWQKNYHITAKSYKGLINAFKVRQKNTDSICITIAPEKYEGRNDQISITNILYEAILDKMDIENTDQVLIISQKYNQVFLILKRHVPGLPYVLLTLIEQDAIKI